MVKHNLRRATEGILEVDEVIANESVSGSFNFQFTGCFYTRNILLKYLGVLT